MVIGCSAARGLRVLGFALAIFGSWVVAAPGPVAADSWFPPQTEVYYAKDKRSRLTVTPRDISNPLDYFEDKVKGKEPAGQRRGSAQNFARGVLERQRSDGQWAVVWTSRLVNEVSPVSALVANGGPYTVTFDNWHSTGFGDNVIVIYGSRGELVRSLKLSDILPGYYIEALPRSVSSMQWSGAHYISESDGMLVLQIVVPSDRDDREGPYVERRIRLSNGHVVDVNDPPWQRALSEAARVARAKKAAEEAADAAFKAPLLGPKSTKEVDWHLYLEEAFFRLDPNWNDGFPAVQVLRAPDARDYAPSEGWLREEMFREVYASRVVMIASPSSSDNLVNVLGRIVGQMKPGALTPVRVYVAVPDAYRGRVAAALSRTGAHFVHIDPARPIPQRKERLEARFGEGQR